MAERKYFNMKKDIHPDYRQVVFMDTPHWLPIP